MQSTPRLIETAGSVIESAKAVSEGLAAFSDVWKPVLDNIGAWVKLADGIAEALCDQINRDEKIRVLLDVIRDVYSFVKDAEPLNNWKDTIDKSQQKILSTIAKQTVDCAYFIRDYAQDASFVKRTARSAIASKTDAQIEEYQTKFRELQTAFQQRAILNTDIIVHRVLDRVGHIAKNIKDSEINSNLRDIPYAGAGFQSDKGCLPGTRKALLEEIESWVNNTDDAPRVCVLLGPAGTGKSSIANEVARRFWALRRLGSSFCFDRAKQASRRPEHLFSSMARDLADHEPHFKQALSEVICDSTDLRHTTDPARQFDDLILRPLKNLCLVGPIVVVIDALDESGDESTRQRMLAILATRMSGLPPSFRVLIASRPEPDIAQAFELSIDTSPHFLRMDDRAYAEQTTSDILAYIHAQRTVSIQLRNFLVDERCKLLARTSEGLFQWASVACSYLGVRSKGGLAISVRFQRLIERSADAAPHEILNALYLEVLREHFHMNDTKVEQCFKSVMGCILSVYEPLSISALVSLCHSIHDEDILEMFNSVLGCMGSLLSGVHDSSIPIRPLHTSFHDFLTTKKHSAEFYVNPDDYHNKMTSVCLQIMQAHLEFNICQLETSYTFNRDVQGLEHKI
ncbi:hypothetical protein OF83DRAFT_1071430, partial [Amylostereum chailletii]